MIYKTIKKGRAINIDDEVKTTAPQGSKAEKAILELDEDEVEIA